MDDQSFLFFFFQFWFFYQKSEVEKEQVSISPTFYKQLFCTKVFRAAFLYLHCRFVLFWHTEIGAKAAHKMSVKLTPCFCFSKCSLARVSYLFWTTSFSKNHFRCFKYCSKQTKSLFWICCFSMTYCYGPESLICFRDCSPFVRIVPIFIVGLLFAVWECSREQTATKKGSKARRSVFLLGYKRESKSLIFGCKSTIFDSKKP